MADFWTAPDIITSLPYADIQDTTSATDSPDDPIPALGVSVGDSSNTVWYQWTSNITGRICVSCVESDYDTMLSIWTRPAGSFIEIASNDFQATNTEAGTAMVIQSEVEFSAVAGTVYYFMVGDGAFAGGGTLDFRVWADNASGALSLVQETSGSYVDVSDLHDSQGNFYRLGQVAFYDQSAVTCGGFLHYAFNVVGGTCSIGGCTLNGVASGNTLLFFRWQRDGSGTEQWLVEIAGLSQVIPRDVTWDAFGNAIGSVGRYETAFPGATSHSHSVTPRNQSAVGMWIAFNCSNADATASTPTGFTAFASNDAQRRAFYRVTSSPETGVSAAFTTSATSMLGAAIVSFRSAVTAATIAAIIDNLDNICCSEGDQGTVTNAGGGQSNGAEPFQTPLIGDVLGCVGGGTVPTQADIVWAETWWG